MPSFTVENYIKAIYRLSKTSEGGVNTNSIAETLGTKAATVSDMLRKLNENGYVNYKKYQGTNLTTKGKDVAIQIIRKHRMWEVFLVDKLEFKWDEVHDLAEELEHIGSSEITNRLEEFLDFPKVDPHGDPIPDREGNIDLSDQIPLTELLKGESGLVTGVKDSSSDFLRYLDAQGIQLGKNVKIEEIFDYDQSRTVIINKKQMSLSHQVCKNLYINKQ
ncbi:MAG: metal-dependent transcriptional regulator [Flavobacteriales bacterium]|jgi:DtxR family Mn-dependent transcriptional regulator|nr:metal-dependent transcriptional regulator [Flavobacteriales bacterium]MBT4704362.1 metal-dependent transcriptional regulator [Flavobacteriales bacterium]MBT4930482.1 metal-dependent transcriptional regulator [Flavobacteriales bacterium]MBT5131758.1 metal-dependent transcriptional regulator [Flavobacteriales bacterium]MBT5977623.1 metal-dependent transcriptional regulator [Flavobacteriales bacterium]